MGISLSKGEKISLAKAPVTQNQQAGVKTLHKIAMALGWEPAPKKKGFFSFIFGNNIDLDASCAVLDNNNSLTDLICFHQLTGCMGAIRHSGDNLTGEGEGDDEVIFVDLDLLPPNIFNLFFTVTSYQRQTFDEIKDAYCRLIDIETNQEIARYTISGSGSNTAMIMCRIFRDEFGAWNMQAVGAPEMAHVPDEIAEKLINYL